MLILLEKYFSATAPLHKIKQAQRSYGIFKREAQYRGNGTQPDCLFGICDQAGRFYHASITVKPYKHQTLSIDIHNNDLAGKMTDEEVTN